MQNPATYSQATRSNDWTLYFNRQMSNDYFNMAYDPNNLEFAIWTTARNDGVTIAWIQSGTERDRAGMQARFPDADWIGSTSPTEEFQQWFRTNESWVGLSHIGTYQMNEPNGHCSGRAYIDEAMATCDALREDEGAPQPLVRTQARIYELEAQGGEE